ncbi:uncharacterized protein LOC115631858 isoform X2 [Scaptodrosophila lebanonensis]|uniref:Uncharacterized protein LOC115631858 isoform X2 n=1 Tax=Drosophila lebanonensis TaxID=7225 RepID=A0A6J2U993_DROLE|nr:uncharacterized protein LOC115631858 isoform X2 [Scaptodrosophila lebanonensis]
MGGKSYYCDYCRCFMKNDLNVRKLHNSGLSHTVAKVTFMKQFEDPRKLLEEERAKIPCTRFSAKKVAQETVQKASGKTFV